MGTSAKLPTSRATEVKAVTAQMPSPQSKTLTGSRALLERPCDASASVFISFLWLFPAASERLGCSEKARTGQGECPSDSSFSSADRATCEFPRAHRQS